MANENTVRFNGHTLQLIPDEYRASYARATVEVQERLDGTIVVVHQGRTLATESRLGAERGGTDGGRGVWRQGHVQAVHLK